MSDIVPLRVVATHDFCCSYVPSRTSYGSLPGGEEEIRAVAKSAWPKPQAAWGFDATSKASSDTVALAVLEGDAAEHVLGRRVGWQQTGTGLREAVGETLR
jgi:hypothetical protein